MVNFFICIIMIGIFTACIKIPEPQISHPDHRIAAAAADLLILQHALSSIPVHDGSRDSIRCVFLRRIYSKYQMDSSVLAQNLQAWHAHPVLLDTFHAQLLNHLNLEQVRDEMNRNQSQSSK